jgi:hypothetical protein
MATTQPERTRKRTTKFTTTPDAKNTQITKTKKITDPGARREVLLSFKKKAGRILRAFPIHSQRVAPARGDSTWLFDGAWNYV